MSALPAEAAALSFGPFVLEPANARLWHDGNVVELPPKAFGVLCHLAQRSGRLVTKEELLDAVWGRRFVSESVLKNAVNAVRAALQDDPRTPRYVETVARRGYRFLAPAPAPTADPQAVAPPPGRARRAAADSPAARFVGRSDEAARLQRAADLARDGHGTVVFVAGEAGIGKSALVDVAAAAARATGIVVAVAPCSEQFGGGEPYAPVLDALATLAADGAEARWLDRLRRYAPTWLAQMPWLVSPEERERLARELAGAAPERMRREFVGLIERVDPGEALLWIMEDLHWADAATVGLLGALARHRGGLRCTVLATYRPIDAAIEEHPLLALRHELQRHRQCEEVVLEPFSPADIDAYLAGRAGDAASAGRERFAEALHALTDGLPLFMARVADELEIGAGPAPDWTAREAALRAMQVPPTVAGLIERQLERLPEGVHAMLEAAAVCGPRFGHQLLARLLAVEPALVQPRCDHLARRGEWLLSDGVEALPGGRLDFRYAFRHAWYQRVLLDRAMPAQRLQLHLAAAQAIAGEAHAETRAAEIAHHWEQVLALAARSGAHLAEAAGQAAAQRLRAARAAERVHAAVEALRHYDRALELGLPAAEAALALARSALLQQQLALGPQALSRQAQAQTAARALGDDTLRAEVLLCCARVLRQADQAAEAASLATDIAAHPDLPPVLRADALIIKALAWRDLGRIADAEDCLRAAEAETPAEDVARRADVVATRMQLRYQAGEWAEALPLAERAGALYAEAGLAQLSAKMLGRVGVALLMLGRAEEAERQLLVARERSRAVADIESQRAALLNLVKLTTDRGDVETALEYLREGRALSTEFESPVAALAFAHGFYYCELLRGNLGAALAAADRVLEAAGEVQSVYWLAGSTALVADLMLHLGDLDRVEAMVDAALARPQLAEVTPQWLKIMLRRAWLDLARQGPAAALARIEAMADRLAAQPPEDRPLLDWLRAEAMLARGEVAGALAATAGTAASGEVTAEARTLILAQRLRARRSAGDAAGADLDAALAALDRPLPALEALMLRQAAALALQDLGRRDEAKRLAVLAAAERDRLALSLADWPAARAAFEQRFGGGSSAG